MKFIVSIVIITFLYSCDEGFRNNYFETKISSLEVYTGDSIEAVWRYTIINKTKKDYYLPSDHKSIYTKINGENSLTQDINVKWDLGKYLPPRETLTVNFSTFYHYNDFFTLQDKDDIVQLSKFMSKKIGTLQSFVVLDRDKRYRIEFFNNYSDTVQKNNFLKNSE